MVARGARRPRSALRGLLQPFQPLLLRWNGGSELKNLISAEWMGGIASLAGRTLMSGFYLNELMVRLLPREDAHPVLYDDYLSTLGMLAAHERVQGVELVEPILRRFECNLLREMGYSPRFDRTSGSGELVVPSGFYRVAPQLGVQGLGPNEDTDEADVYSGRTLLTLAGASASIEEVVRLMGDPLVATESKRLLRRLLGHHLGDTVLQSREVMREMQRLV